ncbi:hypothetical protein JB92DRAFT_2939984, partial [Gautieria morchelliformis]
GSIQAAAEPSRGSHIDTNCWSSPTMQLGPKSTHALEMAQCGHALWLTLHHTPSLSLTLYPHTPSRVPSLLYAVHAPSLLKEDLDALWAIDNVTSVDGELIIIGPYAESILNCMSESSKGVPEDWESEPGEAELPPPLHTFIILTLPFRPSLMTLLPPTLTHLVLLNVSQMPLRTLPASKWTKLTLLGLRGCGICDADAWMLKKRIDEHTLIDVEIVLTE